MISSAQRLAIVKRHVGSYQQILKRIRDVELEATAFGSQHDGAVVQSSGTSDPTQRGAELMERSHEDRKWIEAIDDAMDELKHFEPDAAEVLRLYYRIDTERGYDKRKAKAIRLRYMERHHVSESWFYEKLRNALFVITLYAEKRTLF